MLTRSINRSRKILQQSEVIDQSIDIENRNIELIDPSVAEETVE